MTKGYMQINYPRNFQLRIDPNVSGILHLEPGPDFPGPMQLEEIGNALLLSLEKWVLILSIYIADESIWYIHNGADKTCALCQQYPHCEMCPISDVTGVPNCEDTPYDEYITAHEGNNSRERAIYHAAAEVRFISELIERKAKGAI